jgi:hypothetical protein
MTLMMLRIFSMCVLVFCVVSVVWLVLSLCLFFKVVNWWIGPCFIFESCSYCQFFSSHIPVTMLGLDLFSGAYINKFMFLWCAFTDSSSV